MESVRKALGTPHSSSGLFQIRTLPKSCSASPTSPGGSADGTPAHEKIRNGSGKSRTRFIQFYKLAQNVSLDREELRDAIGGKGSVKNQKDLHDVCHFCFYTADGKKLGLFDGALPSLGLDYGHVVIHGGTGQASFIEGGIPYEALDHSSWLGIEYREA